MKRKIVSVTSSEGYKPAALKIGRAVIRIVYDTQGAPARIIDEWGLFTEAQLATLLLSLPSAPTSPRHEIRYRFLNVVNLAPTDKKFDDIQLGTGRLLYAIFKTTSLAGRNALCPLIRTENSGTPPNNKRIDLLYSTWTFEYWNAYVAGASTPGLTVGMNDTVNNRYSFICTLPVPFRNNIQIGFYNASIADTVSGEIVYVIEVLT